MSTSVPFGGDYSLDTKSFSEAAELCTNLAEAMGDLKENLDSEELVLLESWLGDGSSMFQKKYHFLAQQLGDLIDELHELAEQIYSSEDVYIQTDMNTAKGLDGVSSPG